MHQCHVILAEKERKTNLSLKHASSQYPKAKPLSVWVLHNTVILWVMKHMHMPFFFFSLSPQITF